LAPAGSFHDKRKIKDDTPIKLKAHEDLPLKKQTAAASAHPKKRINPKLNISFLFGFQFILISIINPVF
jgi:hypothetical protein